MTQSTMTIAAVIPLYNGERFIRDAIMSVMTQTLPPDVIVVVDDGSTDNGPAIVRSLAETCPITMLSKPNSGQSSARNFAIRQTQTTHIALLDQDDIWYPNHLAALARPFAHRRTAPLGWVYGNLDEIDESGLMVIRDVLRSLPFHHPKRDLFQCLARDMFVLPSASLIARAAFDAIGGFDEQLSGYEDDDFFLRLFRHGYENIFIDRALTQWRMHKAGTSWSPRMARSRMIYVRKLLEAFPDNYDRARYVSRDLIAPRFFPSVLAEYRKAVMTGDAEAIRLTWQDVRTIARLHRFAARAIVALVSPVFSNPGLMRLLVPAIPLIRMTMPWIMRRIQGN